ncbi:MAG: NAD(+)/NADH kinase [Thermoproteota archaeon]
MNYNYYKKVCVLAKDEATLAKIKQVSLEEKIRPERIEYYEVNKVEGKIPRCDLLVVAGGDGSLFYSVDRLEDNETLILHVNLGRKGVLAEAELAELEEKIEALKNKKYSVEEVRKIEAYVNNEKLGEAINEIVFASESLKGIMEIEVEVESLGTFCIDATGILVATPLGSTAFSMSAGGPVVDNSLEALVITPILAKRKWAPLVVSNNKKIKIVKRGGKEKPTIIRDGLEETRINEEDRLYIVGSRKKVKLIRFDEQYLLRRLRRALIE